MRDRLLRHLCPTPVLYLTIGVVLCAGGSYAFAATTSKTIKVCADKSTGVMHFRTRGGCNRHQTSVSWNQRGPQGPQGKIGATGAAGQAPPSAWAVVSNNGTVGVGASSGISVAHVSAGTYQVTVTAPACAGKQNVPVVAVSDSNPPGGQTAGAFALAWVGDAGIHPFTVYTGDVVNGTFTASDHTFNVQDVCGP